MPERQRSLLDSYAILALLNDERQVLIEPVAEDPVSAVRGLLKGGPSLTTALTEERRAEYAREAEKSARFLRDPGSSE